METNSRIEEYKAKEPKKRGRYKADYQGLFEHKDGTKSVCLKKHDKVEVGEDFRDSRGILQVIKEVVEISKHTGVFENEKDRWNVALVKSNPVYGV